jgi:hypothetical protein
MVILILWLSWIYWWKYPFITQIFIKWNVTYLKIWRIIIWEKVQTFYWDVLSFHNAKRLIVKVQINFTYANKKNAAIHAPMYTKQSSAQKKCMQISCTEFYPNPKMNVNIREALHFSSQSKAWLSLYRFIPNSKLFFTFLSAFLEPNFFFQI